MTSSLLPPPFAWLPHFSLYIFHASPHCYTAAIPQKPSFFSSTFIFTPSFHYSLPLLIQPPTYLFPHTSLACLTRLSFINPHSSSNSPASLSFTLSYASFNLSWYSRFYSVFFSTLPPSLLLSYIVPLYFPALLLLPLLLQPKNDQTYQQPHP